MGKCRENTKKVFKVVWSAISPALLRPLGEEILDIERRSAEDPAFWTDHMKRASALAFARGLARASGVGLKESAARLAVEGIVFALKKAMVKVEDLGEADNPFELGGLDVPETPSLPGGGA